MLRAQVLLAFIKHVLYAQARPQKHSCTDETCAAQARVVNLVARWWLASDWVSMTVQRLCVSAQ